MPITERELRQAYGRRPSADPQRMFSVKHENVRQIYEIAKAYGATISRLPTHIPAWDCWADRILWIPVAAKRSPSSLASAVAEANRYAGDLCGNG